MLSRTAIGRESQKGTVFMMKWVDGQPSEEDCSGRVPWHWKMKTVSPREQGRPELKHVLTNSQTGTHSLPSEDANHSVCHYACLFAPCWTFSHRVKLIRSEDPKHTHTKRHRQKGKECKILRAGLLCFHFLHCLQWLPILWLWFAAKSLKDSQHVVLKAIDQLTRHEMMQ